MLTDIRQRQAAGDVSDRPNAFGGEQTSVDRDAVFVGLDAHLVLQSCDIAATPALPESHMLGAVLSTEVAGSAATYDVPFGQLRDTRELEAGVLAFSVGGSPWLIDLVRHRFQRLLSGTDPEQARLFGVWQPFSTLTWDGVGGFSITPPNSTRRLRVSTVTRVRP